MPIVDHMTETRGAKLGAVELLSLGEAADLLGVSRWTMRRMVEAGEIPAYQFGGRAHRPVRLRASDVLGALQGWQVR